MKHLIAGAMLVGTAVSAQAADMAVKAPYRQAPVMAVYDWTGFYFGANAGIGLSRDRIVHDIPGNSFDTTYLQPQGAIGGGQLGLNWQTGSFLGPIVFGIEADIQGAGMRDDRTVLNGLAGITTSYNRRLDWFGTVRGRVGLANGPVLSYVTAGYAYGNVRTNVTETLGLVSTSTGLDRMQGGYVIGSGVEASLGGNWTGKIEYLYMNLGNKTDGFTAFAVPQTLTGQVRENIFRAGLNYRIGGNSGYAPVAAANWSGFYLGGNVGSGIGRDRSSLTSGAVTELFNLAPDGINGGVQAGYNWQAANWVFGIEADIQAARQRDNRTCVLTCTAGLFAAYDARLPWFGTARARLGYSVGSTLFYATGGYAYGKVKTDIAFPTANVSISETKGGYAVGGGIETPFTLLGLFGPNWTSKTEYLYVDLGSSSASFSIGPVPFTATTRVTEHVFRTGLNYHFNSPVVARY